MNRRSKRKGLSSQSTPPTDDLSTIASRTRRAALRSAPIEATTVRDSSTSTDADSDSFSDSFPHIEQVSAPTLSVGHRQNSLQSSRTDGKRGRMPQGGFDFDALVLPVASLKGLRKHHSSSFGHERVDAQMTDRLLKATAALTLNALPEILPCRDEEKAFIQNILDDFALHGDGRSLYICGVPGTGKTATVLEVANRYKNRQNMEVVVLNCLSMATAADLYPALLARLIGKHSGKQSAYTQLSQYFKSTKKLTLVVLDEMDVLLTKKSTELYNLFEWCSAGGRICVLGIANTIDLPKRLPSATQRRFGTSMLIFKPYNKKQIETIVRNRLGDVDVFEDIAIQRAAAKIAHSNGDVRRCLQLLQLSIDVFRRPDSEDGDQITAHHVGEAISEMFGDEILTDLDITEKLILASIVFCSRGYVHSQDGVSALEILDRVHDSGRLVDIRLPNDAFLLKIMRDLHTVGIVKVEDTQKRLFEHVTLNVDEEALMRVISDDNRLDPISNSLRLH